MLLLVNSFFNFNYDSFHTSQTTAVVGKDSAPARKVATERLGLGDKSVSITSHVQFLEVRLIHKTFPVIIFY